MVRCLCQGGRETEQIVHRQGTSKGPRREGPSHRFRAGQASVRRCSVVVVSYSCLGAVWQGSVPARGGRNNRSRKDSERQSPQGDKRQSQN